LTARGNGIAPFHDFFTPNDGGAVAQLFFLDGYLAPGATILDIGAGTGRLAIELAARGHHVTALEPDAHMRSVMLTRLAEREDVAPRFTLLPEDAFVEGTFDMVTSLAVLHLVPDARERRDMLEFAHDHMAEGAHFVVEVPIEGSDRLAKEASVVARRRVGEVDYEHASEQIPLDAGRWRTVWTFRARRAGRVLEENCQVFDYRVWEASEFEAELRAAGLTVAERFGGFDRAAFHAGRSRALLAVCERSH
jgi:SAM-dependent methyltransferase